MVCGNVRIPLGLSVVQRWSIHAHPSMVAGWCTMSAHNALLEIVDDQDVIHDMIEYVPFMYDQEGEEQEDAIPTPSKLSRTSSLQRNDSHEYRYRHTSDSSDREQVDASVTETVPDCRSASNGAAAVNSGVKRTRLEWERSAFADSMTITQEVTRPTQWSHSFPKVSQTPDPLQTEAYQQTKTKPKQTQEPRAHSSIRLLPKAKKRQSAVSSHRACKKESRKQPSFQHVSTSETVSVTSLFKQSRTEKRSSSGSSDANTPLNRRSDQTVKATDVWKKPRSSQQEVTVPPQKQESNIPNECQSLTQMFRGSNVLSSRRVQPTSCTSQNGGGSIPTLIQKWEASRRTRQHDVTTLKRKTDFTNAMHANCDCSSRFPSRGCQSCNITEHQWLATEPYFDSTIMRFLWTNSKLKRPWILLRCTEYHVHSKYCLAWCTVLDCPPSSVQSSSAQITPEMEIGLLCHAADVSEHNVAAAGAFRLWGPWSLLRCPSSCTTFIVGSDLVPV
eukprot:gb/GECG01011274.1/.p1 GENE.gb/GECG01011274.1/~~gb/GECG01011274.1/.p1  ORF type:complete len:502 (+),score=40.45 gb/GECG01011274.1/:1-1506(+)